MNQELRTDVIRGRRSERGSALILALLVIIALTGLGLVGLKHTSFEMRTANNAKFARQALYVAETGMVAGHQRVGANGQVFWDYMSRVQHLLQRERNINEVPSYALSSQEFLTNGKIYGAETSSFEKEQNTNASFTITFSDPRDGPRPAGFSREFCFKRFTFESTGKVGEDPLAEVRWNDAVRTATSSYFSHALVGPLLCDEGAGL